MCIPAIITALGPVFSGLGLGAVGATGAVAAAGTLGTLGTLVSVGGAVLQGVQGMAAARQQAAVLNQQAATEAQLTATQDNRQRARFASQISQQRAELAARGVTLDSPTAIALGQTAAQEMSFQSQATRSDGQARQIELSAAARYARAQGVSSLLRGMSSAASGLLEKAPDLWPGFFKDGYGTGSAA